MSSQNRTKSKKTKIKNKNKKKNQEIRGLTPAKEMAVSSLAPQESQTGLAQDPPTRVNNHPNSDNKTNNEKKAKTTIDSQNSDENNNDKNKNKNENNNDNINDENNNDNCSPKNEKRNEFPISLESMANDGGTQLTISTNNSETLPMTHIGNIFNARRKTTDEEKLANENTNLSTKFNDINAAKNELQEVIDECKEELEVCVSTQKEIKTKYQSYINDIDCKFQELLELLIKHQNNLKNKINEIKTQKLDKLNTQHKQLADSLQILTKVN